MSAGTATMGADSGSCVIAKSAAKNALTGQVNAASSLINKRNSVVRQLMRTSWVATLCMLSATENTKSSMTLTAFDGVGATPIHVTQNAMKRMTALVLLTSHCLALHCWVA